MPRLPTIPALALRQLGLSLAFLAAGGGCGGDDPVGPDRAPVIGEFTVDKSVVVPGELLSFQLHATDDAGLDSAVVDYGDSARTSLALRGRVHLAASVSRYYAAAGVFEATLSVYDTRGQSAAASLTITVNPPPPPQ